MRRRGWGTTRRGIMCLGWGGGRRADPIGLGDGVNRYAYPGSPIAYSDRNGLAKKEWTDGSEWTHGTEFSAPAVKNKRGQWVVSPEWEVATAVEHAGLMNQAQQDAGNYVAAHVEPDIDIDTSHGNVRLFVAPADSPRVGQNFLDDLNAKQADIDNGRKSNLTSPNRKRRNCRRSSMIQMRFS